MSYIIGKSLPPGFIIDACRCIEHRFNTLYDSISVFVEPESLKRLRSGSALDNDVEMVKKYFPEMTTPGMLQNILSGSDTNVWLLTICWILLRKYSWNNLLLPSLTRCVNFNIQIAPLSIYQSIGHISISFDKIPAEIVTMQYRTIIQKLNKYHQLDRSRVMIFQDIHKILSDIADYYANTSTTGNTITGDSEIFNLTHSNMSRLLDNLWTSAALVDDTTTTTTITKQSAKGNADTKQKQKYEQRENLEESGIDILRTEYDSIRQIYNESQQYSNSECSFLKWVSAVAIVPSQLKVHYSAPNIDYLYTHSAHSSDTSLPIPPASPYKAPSTGSSSSGSSRGKIPDDRQTTAAAETALDTAILDAVPVLGTLEECLLEVIDSYELDWLEVSRISSQIDQQYTEVGLTFEEIDQSFQFLSQHETENIVEEKVPMNIYDILDSECTPEMFVNTVENEVFQRHLLKQLSIPVPSAMKELEELRKLHDHTLHRVAKACEKYNPYEIVWSKNAQ